MGKEDVDITRLPFFEIAENPRLRRVKAQTALLLHPGESGKRRIRFVGGEHLLCQRQKEDLALRRLFGQDDGDVLLEIRPVRHRHGRILPHGKYNRCREMRVPVQLLRSSAEKVLCLKIVDPDGIYPAVLKQHDEIPRVSLQLHLRVGRALQNAHIRRIKALIIGG